MHVLPALLNVVGHLRDNRPLDLWYTSSNKGVILRAGIFTSKSEVEIFASAVMNSGAERMHVVGEHFGSASKPSSDVKETIAVSLNEYRSVSDRSAPLVERGR